MKNDLVVKDNALINASYSLGVVEQRLILLAIVILRKKTHNNQLYSVSFDQPIAITADSYIETFGVNQSTAYETLKDACKSLFSRQFSYQEPRERGVIHKTTRWVSDIAYVDHSASIEFTFAPAVLPLITYLEKHLTSYQLRQVAYLTSGYAIRLYELLIAWRRTGKTPVIDLIDLRSKLGIGNDKYQRMGQFKEKVLHIAIDQLNKHTDITAYYEQHKQGRTIIGFSFHFKHKENVKKIISEKQAQLFARQLIKDSEFSGKFSHIGESYLDFSHRIAKQLTQTEYQEKYALFLRRIKTH
ncbi:replication initiation protein RepM [Acinetobacter boissieri]|uniref:Initiator Replication protein n=1 Tax=Acinetobacter boissieri TaxID=1219383 RepID=A0A1G6KHT6_9GAMM|nr:replication initiation protein RepM [Acinetobacter boissieri]SDC30662.1 Initiator Replication protein [Acinetobacter boissieri]